MPPSHWRPLPPRSGSIEDDLKGLKAVGERLFYAIIDQDNGDWLGVAVFMGAARRLRHRDRWIGWDDEQRRRRLPLVVNNPRFLLLPHKSGPNLGSVALKLLCKRLSGDWMERYGHPVVAVETFVGPERFNGTVYTASGWEELGLTNGNGAHLARLLRKTRPPEAPLRKGTLSRSPTPRCLARSHNAVSAPSPPKASATR